MLKASRKHEEGQGPLPLNSLCGLRARRGCPGLEMGLCLPRKWVGLGCRKKGYDLVAVAWCGALSTPRGVCLSMSSHWDWSPPSSGPCGSSLQVRQVSSTKEQAGPALVQRGLCRPDLLPLWTPHCYLLSDPHLVPLVVVKPCKGTCTSIISVLLEDVSKYNADTKAKSCLSFFEIRIN